MLRIQLNQQEYLFDKKMETVLLNGQAVNADVVKIDRNKFHVLINNQSYNIELLAKDEQAKNQTILVNGKKQTVEIKDKYDDLLKQLGMDKLMGNKANLLKAPMPGLVLKVLVSEGQAVKKGDGLLILEAMKMENIIKATTDGVVKKIHIAEKNVVDKNQKMIDFE
ncbi:MAG: biotin/lipoyl-containing protein [Bacteroidota bacterium]